MSKITCFLPCRLGSQRVPNKNIRKFANFNFGLIEIKLKQLQKSELVDEIIVSTNDSRIINYVNTLSYTKLRLHRRDNSLANSATSTDELIYHALDLVRYGEILWTHVTSPFITSEYYDEIIKTYILKKQLGYDSLMTVNNIHGFLWRDGKPVNYDRQIEKWPRTQTLEPISEVNSGVFLASAQTYTQFGDRIGEKPYLYTLDRIVGYDIDWFEDFIIAECIVEKGLVDL